MKASELITLLKEAMRTQGDTEVVGILNGEDIKIEEVKYPEDEEPIYLELSKF